jgi:hypothetical protein
MAWPNENLLGVIGTSFCGCLDLNGLSLLALENRSLIAAQNIRAAPSFADVYIP